MIGASLRGSSLKEQSMDTSLRPWPFVGQHLGIQADTVSPAFAKAEKEVSSWACGPLLSLQYHFPF